VNIGVKPEVVKLDTFVPPVTLDYVPGSLQNTDVVNNSFLDPGTKQP